MKNAIKIILLAVISAALAILAEQLAATLVNIFWQREIVLESYQRFTWFLGFAAAIEEISKYWAVAAVIRQKFGLERRNFVLAAFFFGAVWGIFEIGLVLFANSAALAEFQAGNPQILFSFASIVALHALTAFFMGTSISAGIFSDRLKHLKILFFPVLVHLFFNFLTIQRASFADSLIIFTLGLSFLATAAILAFARQKLA